MSATLTVPQPDEVPPPTISDTFLVRGPRHLYNISAGRFLNKQTPEHLAYEATGAADQEPQDEAKVALQAALSTNANGESRKRKAKARSS